MDPSSAGIASLTVAIVSPPLFEVVDEFIAVLGGLELGVTVVADVPVVLRGKLELGVTGELVM